MNTRLIFRVAHALTTADPTVWLSKSDTLASVFLREAGKSQFHTQDEKLAYMPELLDIPKAEAEKLFSKTYSPDHTASCLAHLIVTGKVDWEHTVPIDTFEALLDRTLTHPTYAVDYLIHSLPEAQHQKILQNSPSLVAEVEIEVKSPESVIFAYHRVLARHMHKARCEAAGTKTS